MARAGRQRLVLGMVEVVRRAEHRQRGIALELVDEPVMAVHLVDDHREEPVEQFDHLGRRPAGHQLRGADDVDEDHRDVAFLAAQLWPLLLGGRGHLAADVPAEQIADTFAFAQTVRPSS